MRPRAPTLVPRVYLRAMEPKLTTWQRLCVLALRLAGVIGGLTILSLAAYQTLNQNRTNWDWWLIGITFPVVTFWLARVLQRAHDD